MQVEEYDESADPLHTPTAQKSNGSGWSSSVLRGNAGLLTQSMKKMISSRPRVLNIGLGMNLRSNAAFSPSSPADGSARDGHYEQEMELFASFAAAVDRKSKDEMVSIIAQTPQLVHIRNHEDEQLALHLVCKLVPNYFYVDVIEMMVNANRESPACMDKSGQTPLHLLCQNTSITLPALTTLLTILPAAAWMCDKQSNLALHYLCMNPNVDVTMLQQLGQDETLHLRNAQNQTPLHCLAIAQDFHTKKSPFLFLLDRCADAADVVDAEGRYVLHWVCEARGVDLEVLEKVITEAAAQSPDCHQDQPLHILCQNLAVDKSMLKRLLHMNPDAVYARTENDLTALHFLCANEAVDPVLLDEFLGFDKLNTTPGSADKYGATPVHVLCMNESIKPAHLRALLVVCTDDALTQDIHGCSPLHYLCMNRAITSELVWLFLERAEELVREIDCEGRTPLHHLCANHSVAAITLEILYDACPSAAMVADKQLRLPVQYLVDNSSSPAETTATLISGPSSYRLRYEFVGVVGGQQAAQAFHQQGVLVYRQNNLAMDTTTSRKVLITFFSTQQAIDHEREKLARLNLVAERLICERSSSAETPCSLEDGKANSSTVDGSVVDTTTIGDYRMPVLETFDDAKRRVALRSAADLAPEEQIGDACVTLQHGLVIEAPAYTLDALFSERLDDIENLRMVIADIGACLHFWHREALMVHGNVNLTSIGHFPGRGLRLIHMHTSREFHEHTVVVGRKAMDVRTCPPEATRAFLANESFLPTPESDIWQFGCLMYHLITGQSLVTALASWSEGLGDQHILHLLSAITNEVIQQLIDKVEPNSLRGLLQSTLLINPAQRWTIDRLMHIDAFRVERDASASESFEEMSSKVQRRVDAELLSVEHQRSAKHAQDQLAFVRNEQRTLRSQFLTTKTRLREVQEARDLLSAQVVNLSSQLEHLTKHNESVQQEVSVFARNHQSMTLQLHTTMQMLVNLVPLVKNVYGANSDEFLSNVLSQASGSETLSTIDIGGTTGFRNGHSQHRRKSAVQLVKRQLQNSILAQGCIHTWAHSTPPPILEPHELSYSSSSLCDDSNTLSSVEVNDRESEDIIKDVGIFLEPEEQTDNQEEHEET